MTIGENIKKIRKSQRLTQAELAKRLKVTAAMISQYENNINPPKLDTLNKIANALNVNILEIIESNTLYDIVNRAIPTGQSILQASDAFIDNLFDDQTVEEYTDALYQTLIESNINTADLNSDLIKKIVRDSFLKVFEENCAGIENFPIDDKKNIESSKRLIKILHNAKRLNKEGQEKYIEYGDDLIAISKYTKKDPD